MAAPDGDPVIAAAVLAALAVAMLTGPAPAAALARLRADGARADSGGRFLSAGRVVALVASCGTALLTFPDAVLWLLTAGTALGTAVFLLRARLLRRRVRVTAEECARSAHILAGLMEVGQIPTAALAEAASDCPVLGPAAAAAGLGADVGAELERSARLPGQESLATVAAAWRLGQRSGAPMARILNQVAGNLRRERQLDAMIEAELAAARTSGHIMAALPALAVGLGFAVGVDPVGYLLGESLGRVLLLVGVVLTAGGVLWIEALSRPRGMRR